MSPSSDDPRVSLARNRTSMAKFRTQLALDRTTLAWIRTALTMGTFGFGMIGFFRTMREKSPTPEAIHMHQGAIRFGISLVILGLASTVGAAIAHWYALRSLRREQDFVVAQWPLSITVAMFLALIGLISLWYVVPR